MTIRMPRSLILLAALGPALAAAQAPAAWPAFTRAFAAYVDSDKVVGASVVVHEGRHASCALRHGFADRAANVRVDSQTIFHWGSITKTLTAISIMQLRDRGKLSLDDKIVRWVPELRTMHDPYGMMDSITSACCCRTRPAFRIGTWPYGNDKPWEPFEPTTWNQLVAMMPYQELRVQARLAVRLLESRLHLSRARRSSRSPAIRGRRTSRRTSSRRSS